MASERGTGHLLSKKLGPCGQNSSAYGGSLTLTGASVKNHRMDRQLHAETGQVNRQWEVAVKTNYARRLDLQRQLSQLELSKRTVTYLDGDRRGHPVTQWDAYTCRKFMPLLQEHAGTECHNYRTRLHVRQYHSPRPKQHLSCRSGVTKHDNANSSDCDSQLPQCVVIPLKLNRKLAVTNVHVQTKDNDTGSREDTDPCSGSETVQGR